jgi:hypothetical protein
MCVILLKVLMAAKYAFFSENMKGWRLVYEDAAHSLH